MENDAFIQSEHTYFPLIPAIARRDIFEKKSLHQGSVARQNKLKTILYHHIGLVFFFFFLFIRGPLCGMIFIEDRFKIEPPFKHFLKNCELS